MSDYFGALQRLANAPVSGGESFDLGTQPTGQRVPPVAQASSDESARDAAFEPEPSASVPAGQWAGAKGPLLQDGFANVGELASAAASPVARHGIDSAVHLALQAALRWVAGDPFAAPGDAGAPGRASWSPQHPALSGEPAAAVTPHARPDSARARSAQVPPDRRQAIAALNPHSPQPAPGAPSQATSPLAQDFALDLDLPAGPRPLRARAGGARADHASDAAAASTQPDRVEINIGSIHVSVDAPVAPRSVVPPQPATTQAAAQAAAQAAVQATAHSAFSRSRLPRR